MCRATPTSSPDDCGNCLVCIFTTNGTQGIGVDYATVAAVIILIILLTTVPGIVNNIRAYVYKPTRGSNNLTALVLWDEPQSDGIVSNYFVSMFQDGQRLFPLVS